MTKPKPLSVSVFIQLDNERRCGAHAVATMKCLMCTPAWRKIKGYEFSDSGRSGTRLQLSGKKQEVMDTLHTISSLVRTAGNLGYSVENLLGRLDVAWDRVLREEGHKFPAGNMMSFFL